MGAWKTLITSNFLYKNWNDFDPGIQEFIVFTILAAVGILVAYGAIKILIYFYKLNIKEKIAHTVGAVIALVVMYVLYQILDGWTKVIVFGFIIVGILGALGQTLFDNTDPSICSTCNGYGKVRSTSGLFSSESSCPTCGGEGKNKQKNK
jgi:uncharacterized protein YacL|tara:strand:- start:2082 stop:2531 length:450 start_codon:yes stop_codon:yes gene_type:complete